MISGKIFKYGDDVNTDVIFPGKYTYTVNDPEDMVKHAMEDLDEDFVKTVKEGDVIVGGKNFGCGSSREQAVTCLKYAGIGAVIAVSFARIYFRNCINQGLPVITLKPDEIARIHRNDAVSVDFKHGTVHVGDHLFSFPPLSPEVMQILQAGGLIDYTKAKIHHAN
ncbi:MAG: 3-isopropylmalate dehydratase [bacterium]